MLRVLVTGRDGQVAQSLASCSADEIEVVCLGRPELDLVQFVSVGAAIDRVRPDILVNAAAYTAVDKAEEDEGTAMAVNAAGAGHAARAAAEAGIPIIHISTDYVFDGRKDEPYDERDETAPQGAYGRSKLAGERAVADANPAHVVLRTAWVHSAYGSNFAKTMLRLAAEREVVRVVADQYGTPTFATAIADGILAVARRIQADPQGTNWRGVFHMTAEGSTSWAGFAEAVFAQSAALGGPSARVEPITTADYPTPARRPANSRLATERFRRTFDHALGPWEDGVARCVEQIAAREGANVTRKLHA